MRDLLPDEARLRRLLTERVLGAFALHGYEPLELPALEYADVLALGLGSLDAEAVLRFVEPDSGEVVGLRPDMTAQVARVVATRLADAPGPLRFAYQGTVLRRRHERARRHRQIPQAGVELIGLSGLAGDLEILRTAAAAARAAGLSDFLLDLGHAELATSLVGRLPSPFREAAVEALRRKDAAAAREAARDAGADADLTRALAALPELHGDLGVLAEARRFLAGTPALAALASLSTLAEAVVAEELARDVLVDLGELRSLDYYTGATFQLLAEGPGCAIGSGGRYDRLLARYGTPRPAAGFALDLDHIGWALALQGGEPAAERRVLVAAGPASAALLRALRARGIPCVVAPSDDPATNDAYARATRFTHIVEAVPEGTRLRVFDGLSTPLAPEPDAWAAEVAAALR